MPVIISDYAFPKPVWAASRTKALLDGREHPARSQRPFFLDTQTRLFLIFESFDQWGRSVHNLFETFEKRPLLPNAGVRLKF